MTALEDALAATLAERAGQVLPSPGRAAADLAGRAIASGRAQRRVQMVVASAVTLCVLVTVVVVIVGGSSGTAHEQPVAAPDPTPTQKTEQLAHNPPPVASMQSASTVPMMSRLPVDLVVGSKLVLRDGRSLSLAVTSPVEQIHRAQAGFVVVEFAVVEFATLRRAWYVDEQTGAQAMLFDKATWVAVAGDGSGRLAWVSGDGMYFRASSQSTAAVRRTAAPAEGGPIGFVGDAVLLAGPGTGGGFSRHDLWFPAKGEYQPTWVDFFAVFGTRSAGRELVAARSTARKDLCVSFVTLEGLEIQQTDCELLDRIPSRGWVSPGGRWLVVVDAIGAHVLDLTVQAKPAIRLAPVAPDVGADATWIDSDTLALHEADRLLVLPMQGPAHVVEYLVPRDAVIVRSSVVGAASG